MSVVKKAVDLIATQGKKIGSNISVGGGFKGLQTDFLMKRYNDLDDAHKIATDAFEKGRGIVDKEAIADLLKSKNKAYSRKLSLEDDLTSGISSMAAHTKELSRAGYEGPGIGLQMGKDLAKEYFSGGTKAQNYTRRAVAAGAYMGVNIAGRAVTGGSLGYNREGQRDIAGIPMI